MLARKADRSDGLAAEETAPKVLQIRQRHLIGDARWDTT